MVFTINPQSPLRYQHIILDRDGVVNHDSSSYIKSLFEWRPIYSSLMAISLLCRAGIRVSIASNQSAVARCFLDLNELYDIHSYLQLLLHNLEASISTIQFCPHLPTDECKCRKPKPGMLASICSIYNLTPGDVLFVGDKQSDFEAASSFGCDFLFISNSPQADFIRTANIRVFWASSLYQFVRSYSYS